MRFLTYLVVLLLTTVALSSGANAQQSLLKSKNGAEAKWTSFWKSFTMAIDARDTATIVRLTSPNFYDGGGSTVQQWLQSDVYANDKKWSAFKNMLQKGVKNFKGFEPGPYKATGKNKSGDLFFEYKKGQWLFGGLVSD